MVIVVPRVKGVVEPDTRRSRGRLRRVAIVVFFTSVGVNAALGLSALVIGEFSQTHGRILGTSLLVTAGLLGALACAPAWERRALFPVPVVGAAACAAAVTLGIVAIWSGGESETLGKFVGSAASIALGGILASLLAFPRLAAPFRPVLGAAVALDAVAVLMANVTIWAEIDSSLYARAFGVVAVLLAASAVSVPVLSRIGTTATAEPPPAPVAFCPYCGNPAGTRGASSSCAACGRAFTVRAGL